MQQPSDTATPTNPPARLVGPSLAPSLRSLVVSNAIIALALGLVILGAMNSKQAAAQPASVVAAGDRARGEYTMVSGRFREGSSSAIYIVDSSNQEVVALRWDSSKQQMVGIGYRSIANDSRAARGR